MHGQELRAAWISELTQQSVYQVVIGLPNGQGITGTAFHVKDDKGKTRLITNKHVCYTKQKHPIKLLNTYSGKKYKTKIKRISPKSDLCELAAVGGAPALELDTTYRKHQMVFTPGHSASLRYSIHEGLIIDYDQVFLEFPVEVSGAAACKKYGGSIQQKQTSMFQITPVCVQPTNGLITNISLTPGASGSPIVTAEGKVVGVINKVNRAHWGAGIPLAEVKAFINNKE